MPVIVIANPKGGVGKSTFATNLAGYYAAQGKNVMLGDIDVQQSSRAWLGLRPANLAPIGAWELKDGHVVKPPKGTTHIVLDTPAGLDGKRLTAVLKIADKVIVPLQPSMFDILATQHFLQLLAKRKGKFEVGVLGMRVNARSHSAEQLAAYVGHLDLPVIGMLRDTQNYVQLAAHGATLWDLQPARVSKDLAQWREVLAWINK
ncbi:ParA family protein [Herminiimonas sp. CN]|uniref:ParA family protein n=1 Tax=Herminiimonas sp. CN TaxID=1349818 RepID=UPI0004731655|nr:ParA family protein [Herminiimonas sp. CN]